MVDRPHNVNIIGSATKCQWSVLPEIRSITKHNEQGLLSTPSKMRDLGFLQNENELYIGKTTKQKYRGQTSLKPSTSCQ